MKLCDYLTEDTVVADVTAAGKNDAIAELAGTLRRSPAVRDVEEFLGAVFAREMESSTGIGDGIAVPHARTDSVGDFVAAVGRVPYGVDFQAVDGKPVTLIILMGIPTRMVKPYLKMLAHLSLLVKQPEFAEAVRHAEDGAGLLGAFETFEQ